MWKSEDGRWKMEYALLDANDMGGNCDEDAIGVLPYIDGSSQVVLAAILSQSGIWIASCCPAAATCLEIWRVARLVASTGCMRRTVVVFTLHPAQAACYRALKTS
jgi:hypothetical protein